MDGLTLFLGWMAPLIIIAYVLLLLKRLTRTVAHIEQHLRSMSKDERDSKNVR